MIPKIIHYCWLSDNPYPKDIQSYIDGWKRVLPEYEFMLWNFNRFDITSSIWVREAFEAKKYAFAADYIRLFAIYNYGGIYLDTDVEVLKSFNDFLNLNTMICFESDEDGLEVAIFGAKKGSKWVKQCLNYYDNRHFIRESGNMDMIVLPLIIKNIIENNNVIIKVDSIDNAANLTMINHIPVFPSEYFSPKSYNTGRINITQKTHAIHHFNGSWKPWFIRYENKFWEYFGMNNRRYLKRILIKLGVYNEL